VVDHSVLLAVVAAGSAVERLVVVDARQYVVTASSMLSGLLLSASSSSLLGLLLSASSSSLLGLLLSASSSSLLGLLLSASSSSLLGLLLSASSSSLLGRLVALGFVVGALVVVVARHCDGRSLCPPGRRCGGICC
jgi:hypothetical protein